VIVWKVSISVFHLKKICLFKKKTISVKKREEKWH
jgi:hypothetical protein